MRRRDFVLFGTAAITLAGGLVASSGPAWSQAAVPEAAQFISDLSQRAIADLTDPALGGDERARRFGALLRANFDVPAIAQFVLGRFWRIATESERAEYLKLFEEFLIQNYAKRFTEYSGENLRVDQTRAGQDNEVVITTSLMRTQVGAAKVVWRARRDGAGFRIFDVNVEGVSLVITHRDDFSAVIQHGGGKVEALLAVLRAKIKEGAVA